MTEEEWDKYVQNVAKRIKTPSVYTESAPICGTYGWKTLSTHHLAAKRLQKARKGKPRNAK